VIKGLHDGFKSLQEIADTLHRDKVPTRKGGRWAASTVADILRAIRHQPSGLTRPADDP
jgi:hypothetical protein